jgi:hypothetical protein
MKTMIGKSLAVLGLGLSIFISVPAHAEEVNDTNTDDTNGAQNTKLSIEEFHGEFHGGVQTGALPLDKDQLLDHLVQSAQEGRCCCGRCTC